MGNFYSLVIHQGNVLGHSKGGFIYDDFDKGAWPPHSVHAHVATWMQRMLDFPRELIE
jgi:hypothetical protein